MAASMRVLKTSVAQDEAALLADVIQQVWNAQKPFSANVNAIGSAVQYPVSKRESCVM